MIQRKQSLWLLLAALLNTGVLFLDPFRIHNMVNGADTVTSYSVSQHYPLLVIAIVMIAVPLITIFMFKDRKRQIRMCIASIIAIISFMSKVLMDANVQPPATVTYWIGSILPLVSFVLIIMAISGIRSDEKLVKSVDRLR